MKPRESCILFIFLFIYLLSQIPDAAAQNDNNDSEDEIYNSEGLTRRLMGNEN